MHFRKRNVKFEKVTEEGETPEQTVRGTENPFRMPIVDKIALESAIEQLPAGYKNVFVLHDVEGFEHEEVARILGCSVGTVEIAAAQGASEVEKASEEESQSEVGWDLIIGLIQIRRLPSTAAFFSFACAVLNAELARRKAENLSGSEGVRNHQNRCGKQHPRYRSGFRLTSREL
jgi:hypothetical protein